MDPKACKFFFSKRSSGSQRVTSTLGQCQSCERLQPDPGLLGGWVLGAGSDTAQCPDPPRAWNWARTDLWLSGFQAGHGLHLASPEHGLSVPVLLAACPHQPTGFTPQEWTSISHLPLDQIVFFTFIWRPRKKGPTPQIRDPELGAQGTEDTPLLLSPEQCKHTPKKLKMVG